VVEEELNATSGRVQIPVRSSRGKTRKTCTIGKAATNFPAGSAGHWDLAKRYLIDFELGIRSREAGSVYMIRGRCRER